jgi:putative endonuclease
MLSHCAGYQIKFGMTVNLSRRWRASPLKREINPFVYIIASQRNGTIYIGVTSNLIQRIGQHREGTFPGFTKDYKVKLLVWFEQHDTMENAIAREKQIKAWLREWKLALIEEANPEWRDLAEDMGFDPLG